MQMDIHINWSKNKKETVQVKVVITDKTMSTTLHLCVLTLSQLFSNYSLTHPALGHEPRNETTSELKDKVTAVHPCSAFSS